VLNFVGIQVLQLNLVVVQQPPEGSVGRNREPVLVEGDERYDIAVRRRRCIIVARNDPL
jgi:hypothetical protein